MDTLIKWLLNFFITGISILLFVLGCLLLVYGGYECVLGISGIFDKTNEEEIISAVLKGVDVIFLGVVIQILSLGLLELFVRQIEQIPAWLQFDNFDELKLILIKTSITVLTISFVGKAVTWSSGDDIIYYGVGMGAVIASLSYFLQVKSN